MIKLSPGKIFTLLNRNTKLIVSCMIAGFIAGLLYSLLIFKPVYKSEARLLIKGSSFGESPTLLSTQMEVLKSDRLYRKVWHSVKAKHLLKLKDSKGIARIKNAINIKNPDNTDIIKLTAAWTHPEIAYDIAQAAVLAYKSLNIETERNGFSKNLEAVENKLRQTQKELLEVRNKIKEFRKNNATVDLSQESRELASRITTLENKQQELNLATAAEAYKIKTISQSLGLDSYSLDSIVLTSGMTNLSSKLEKLQDELAGLSTKYTGLHPEIKNIKSRIDRVKGQIRSQMKLNLGKELKNSDLQITDPVTTGMMEVLISSKQKYTQIQARNRSVSKALEQLKQRRAAIPERQFVLSDYEQQETALVNIANTLKTRQAELEVQKTGTPGIVNVVDNPVTPISAAFPGRFELIFIFVKIFGFLATSFVLIREVLKNTYGSIEEIEKDLDTPVLGVIPWLDTDLYDEPDIIFAIEETASFYSLAYQKTVSGLRIKGDFTEKKVLAFTSSESSKKRSTIIMNTAYGLSRTGQSVLVVDADLRTPSIGRESGFEIAPKYSLVELLSSISKDLKETGSFDEEQIKHYVRSIPNISNFFILPNNGNVPDPCEFLYSEAFRHLIKNLKKNYDWVLVDVPPALAVPDAFMAGLYVDGVVLINGLETNKSVIRKIHRQFKNYNINVFGVIAREFQANETVFSNKYIKQMISRMLPHSEGALT